MKKTQQSFISIILVLCMVFGMSFGLTVGVSAAETATATATTFNPGYGAADANTTPAGWTGNGFTLGTWGDFKFNVSNVNPVTGIMILDKYIWTNDSNLEYTSGQTQLFNETGYMYFCYTDTNNYYAVSFSKTSTDLTKVVNGTKTIIQSLSTEYVEDTFAIKIVRTTAGAITVTLTPSGGSATTLFNAVADTAFSSGKIGFGYLNGSSFWTGGYFGLIKTVGSAYLSGGATPSPSPSIAPTPTPSSGGTVTTFQPNYGALTPGPLPADWSGNGLIKMGSYGWISFNSYGTGNDIAVCNKYIWSASGNFELNYAQNNIYGNTTQADLYFFYTDSNNYYSLTYFPAKTELVKKVGGTRTVIATTPTSYENMEHAIKITRNAAGAFTVAITPKTGTAVPDVFGAVTDTSLTSGKIALGFVGGGGYFSGIKVVGTDITTPNPSPSISPSTAPSPTPSSGTGTGTPTTFDPNYGAANANTVPTGWSGNGFTLGNWGDFKFNVSDVNPVTGKLILDKYIWTNDSNLEYTSGQTQLFNETGFMYFCYTDTNNYYAVSFSKTSTDLIKVVNGTKTVIQSLSTEYVEDTFAIKIVRTTAGAITVTLTPSGGSATTLFNAVTDTAFSSGKIGFGYLNGSSFWTGGYFAQIKAVGSAYLDIPGVSASTTDATKFRYVGRAFTRSSATQMSYPLSGIEFMVKNAVKVQVNIKTSSTSYYGIFIDDATTCEPIAVANTSYNYVTINLPDTKAHKIRLVKLPGVNTTIYIDSVKAFGEGVKDPEFYATQPKSRKIEFIGDSITVGYGLFNDTVDAQKKGDTTEMAWRSYAGQTAAYFNADINMPAVSGASFAKDAADPAKYGLTPFHSYGLTYPWTSDASYNWDFNKFVPDVVVVNIGTNDGSLNTTQHYVSFVNLIRTSYNDTGKKIRIILALGPMSSTAWNNLSAAVTQINSSGDNNVYSLNLGNTGTDGVDWHPNIAQSVSTSLDLIAKIKQIMPDWSYDIQLTANAVINSPTSITVGFNTQMRATPSGGSYTVFGALSDESGKLISIKKMTINDSLNHDFVFDNANIANGTKCRVKLFMWDGIMNPISMYGTTPLFTVTK